MDTNTTNDAIPIIVFGAFDRHNLGDLLFPHIAAALLEGNTLYYAGLLERDLRVHGGHRTHSLNQLMKQNRGKPVRILHAGGEVLTCTAWEAAVMLLPEHQVQPTVLRLHERRAERSEWARSYLGTDDLIPYCVSRKAFSQVGNVCYNAIGGVDLLQQDAAVRREIQEKLSRQAGLFVRDRQTLYALKTLGADARLMPDCAVMVAELFGERIQGFASFGETAQIDAACAQGYVAMQFSADFSDDHHLNRIAHQMDAIARETALSFVLFRAGAAPWHDELECYKRLKEKTRTAAVHHFSSLNIWDICALIAQSRGYCGSSLHGRIVATAFAKPRINFVHAGQSPRSCKQAAFVQTWEDESVPGVVELDQLANGLYEALQREPAELQKQADGLVNAYREGFALLEAALLNG